MLFGDKQVFAFEYEFLPYPYAWGEYGIFKDSWSSFRIWARGENTLEMVSKSTGEHFPYEWNLCYIVEWFYRNRQAILTEEGFPKGVVASDPFDFFVKTREISPIFEAPDWEEWHEAKYNWREAHGLRSIVDGSSMPEYYFRKAGETMRLEWSDNDIYKNMGIFLRRMAGTEVVPFLAFQEALDLFLADFTKRLEQQYPKEIAEMRLGYGISYYEPATT